MPKIGEKPGKGHYCCTTVSGESISMTMTTDCLLAGIVARDRIRNIAVANIVEPSPKAIFKTRLFWFSNTNNNGQMYLDTWIGMVYMKT